MGICIATLLSLMCFSGLLFINNIWIHFITIGVFGFFLISYISVGYEYGIELTYPDLEIISASLLTLSAMVFGIALTEISSFIMTNVSVLASNGVLCINLFFCCILSSFMTTEYKRSKKNVDETVSTP
ncbi:feline leukemia virus subgroup C receptor-related protein 2-like [Stegodyphus dumicola]|uniref:feline leukemia virus subgroup C receptor-related protein 2-like n=1 Tax=Stegodyphus dumicola TaxID=202533 RepID=UPI0015B27326|nr:feline leukemia virus subgroup C receptor-related protein 2-like [Stegodyphus dumicola]